MPDPELLQRLARFEKQVFPRYESTFRRLVDEGQQPKTLFIGCSDSRIVPFALMDCGPGDLFIARNVGNLIPPWDMSGTGCRRCGGPGFRLALVAATASLRS